jgi:hypothetical protein
VGYGNRKNNGLRKKYNENFTGTLTGWIMLFKEKSK